jgi:alkanesulfonate monooxygenase SsuD/methylene tetrahydromethanopterin reductase-like flavin-dependent oxidoreductase (luciferase family)
MDVGVCLPTIIPDLKPGRAVEWAKKAEELNFSTLAIADRMASVRYECLIGLAAAAAVTERVRLLTAIMIAPLQPNAIYLAKQAASIDHISNGRLSLGFAPGGRAEDYEMSGLNFHRRGRDLDKQIEVMKATWRGENGVGPAPIQPGGPDVLLGGSSPQTFARVARNNGWIAGAGGGAAGFSKGKEQVMEQWAKAGRDGTPRFLAVGHFSLGPNADANARKVLGYSYGAERAEPMVQAMPRSADAVIELLQSFAEAGCDEMILAACDQDLEQLELYADAAARSKVG